MHLISINVGKARTIRNAKASGKTGIYKMPVSKPVQIDPLGLNGDEICDIENHGGVDQAVYVYGAMDYDWWSTKLGRAIAPGTFGENLTISEMESASFYIGDRFHVGTVILEVTAPRIPCVTLGARMGDPTFVKQFRQAERPGLYCRVIQAGETEVGDSVTIERYEGEPITALEMFHDFFEPDLSEETLRRYLATPIAIRDRVDKEKRLQTLLAELSGKC